MSTIIRARSHIFQPNNRIIRAQFDVEPGSQALGEYVLINLSRERGEWEDGLPYRIIFEPLFKQKPPGG